jgi:DNA-binding MarR family transcriptional regulator
MAQRRPPAAQATSSTKALDFMRLLWTLDHAMQSTSKRMKQELGVTGPQRLVVRMVGQYPGISAGALAERLQLHPSTLTGILDRLVTRRVLSRGADAADGRRALFALTKLGRDYNRVQEGTVEAAVHRALMRCAPGKTAAARAILTAIIAELSA